MDIYVSMIIYEGSKQSRRNKIKVVGREETTKNAIAALVVSRKPLGI